MREYLLNTLDDTRYPAFLVYIMGPYKQHDGADEEMFAFLEWLRDELRTLGFNAFLATDAEIPLEEMDAGTQSLEFAHVSNAVLFVVRDAGRNLGVGIEVGAVLEDRRGKSPERVLFLHEAGMRSAMIESVADRWDARVRPFDGRDELVREVQVFLRDLMRREKTGELPPPPES